MYILQLTLNPTYCSDILKSKKAFQRSLFTATSHSPSKKTPYSNVALICVGLDGHISHTIKKLNL